MGGSKAFWVAVMLVATDVGVVGCGSCSGACATAYGNADQTGLTAPVVKVVANPPCTATVTPVDGGVHIHVTVDGKPTVSSCQIFESLADDTELSAKFSYTISSDMCCDGFAVGGSALQFAPVGS
jgi:hypothetical protein